MNKPWWLLGVMWIMTCTACATNSTILHVNSMGSDTNPGTQEKPLATLYGARDAVRTLARTDVIQVLIAGGTYYLDEPLRLMSIDSGTPNVPIKWQAMAGETVRLVGGRRLIPSWKQHTDRIWKTDVPAGVDIEQLFLNEQPQVLARYPNYAPEQRYYNGAGATWERMKNWKHPETAYIHALHSAKWGSGHIVIQQDEFGQPVERMTGIDTTTQGSKATLSNDLRFVENVFEELDAPREWFFDKETRTLYYQPAPGEDLHTAKVEAVSNPHLVVFEGTQEKPVHDIVFVGFTLSGAAPTWKKTIDHLPNGGDFVVHRGGALVLRGTENCTVSKCTLTALGGNAVFVDGYNRRVTIQGCVIRHIGANGISLCGASETMRGKQFFTVLDETTKIGRLVRPQWTAPDGWYKLPEDLTPGPKTDHYPSECLIDNNLITVCGELEKQTAGVLMSMTMNNTVSHNTIFKLPRAGICIQDGSWGGHIIEHNDVFDTVRETADHGPFNSWGKDRFHLWADHNGRHDMNPDAKKNCLIDAMTPTHIRHNRFSHPLHSTHSWGIDLDDGSTHYQIYNNLCVGCAVKLREGFYRTVENNVFIGSGGNVPGKHICFKGNEDVFRRNIVVNIDGAAVWRGIRHYPEEMKALDFNCYFTPGRTPQWISSSTKRGRTLRDWQGEGLEVHSVIADPLFVNPAQGDYRVRPESPALKLGFKNFSMDQFGVTSASLKRLVPSRAFPTCKERVVQATPEASLRRNETVAFLGGKIKNLTTDAEKSAVGIGEITGVLIVEAPKTSVLYESGLRHGDLIIMCNSQKTESVRTLLDLFRGHDGKPVHVQIHDDSTERRFVLNLAD